MAIDQTKLAATLAKDIDESVLSEYTIFEPSEIKALQAMGYTNRQIADLPNPLGKYPPGPIKTCTGTAKSHST